MERLAREGKGRSIGIFQLPDLLRDYLNSPIEEGNIRRISWPDWRSKDPSGFLPLFVLLFVSLLTLEWYLRRRWGLV